MYPLVFWLYIQCNLSRPDEDKYGFTENPGNRKYDSHEQFSYPTYYDSLYECKIIEEKYKLSFTTKFDEILTHYCNKESIEKLEQIYDCELLNFRNLIEFRLYNGGGDELLRPSSNSILKKVYELDYPKLGFSVRKLTDIELEKINKETRESINNEKLNRQNKADKSLNKLLKNTKKNKTKDLWYSRPYQQELIDYCSNDLLEYGRNYLKLATGGGKTYCVYNIINRLIDQLIDKQPIENIIIFTPRKKISTQNSKSAYRNIIKGKYKFHNCSTKKEFEPAKKNIIVACNNSRNKVVNIIKENNLKNIVVWFDEAHHTIEGWSKDNYDLGENEEYLLTDTTSIKYRQFTSASPDEELVKKNTIYFGKLHNPIKISELIAEKWLCSIKPFMFETMGDNINILDYMLDGFNQEYCNYGFSFHSNCNNALELFKLHRKKYEEGNTQIKPYILFDCERIEGFDKNSYKDYLQIENFETDDNKSMGYVVQMYSLGYDFPKIDFISFSDPKMSYADIVQCIGRGMRPDGKGPNGSNLDKYLTLLLPVLIGENKTEYDSLADVLKYLILDIEIPFHEIPTVSGGFGVGNSVNIDNNYIGEQSMRMKLMDLVNLKTVWIKDSITEHFKRNSITDQNMFNEYRTLRPDLNLPKTTPSKDFPEFKWRETYKGDCPYYEKEECIKRINELKDEYEDELETLDESDDKEEFLNNLDKKIPKRCLNKFYGGEANEFVIY